MVATTTVKIHCIPPDADHVGVRANVTRRRANVTRRTCTGRHIILRGITLHNNTTIMLQQLHQRCPCNTPTRRPDGYTERPSSLWTRRGSSNNRGSNRWPCHCCRNQHKDARSTIQGGTHYYQQLVCNHGVNIGFVRIGVLTAQRWARTWWFGSGSVSTL